MAKKPKAPDELPSKAYLMSFGDTMTALCAFFIVLNSLASEQTGANLHSGTGSFVQAISGKGLPGTIPLHKSRHAMSLEDANPLYIVPDAEDRSPDANPTGPDAEDDGLRIVDREQDDFERFMKGMQSYGRVEQLPTTDGEVSFDFFERFEADPPYINEKHMREFSPILPKLKSPDYSLELVVWATTPGGPSWKRATRKASVIANHLATVLKLRPDERSRLTSVGRTWISSDAKRPFMTLTVKRIQSSSGSGL